LHYLGDAWVESAEAGGAGSSDGCPDFGRAGGWSATRRRRVRGACVLPTIACSLFDLG